MKAFTKSPKFFLSAAILIIALFGCSGLNTPDQVFFPTADPTQSPLSSLAQIQARGVLIVGTAITEPFVFHDPATDDLTGFDIDLAGEIAESLGVTLGLVEMPFANLIPALQDHKVDMTIAAMYITDDRKKMVDFSQPYLDSGLVMAALPGQQVRIETVQDLEGLRVGVKIGATGAKKAQELVTQGINLEIVEYKDTFTSFLDLEVGRVDVIFNDYLNTLAYIKDTRSEIRIVTNQAGEVYYLSQAGLGIAVQQNSPELLGLINTRINEMKQDGTLDQLYKFWLLPTVED
ncbi:MAG: transporter substrate-binding domain-containing protein [Chloroflexota bacterium]